MTREHRVRLNWFLGASATAFALAIWGAVGLPWRARIFPQTVAAIGLVLTVLSWSVAIRADAHHAAEEASVPGDAGTEQRPARARRYVAWVVSYLAAIALAGFPAASAICVWLFLWREDRMPWRFAIAAAAAVAVVLMVLTRIARMPGGWLLG